jgi:hypothetical protein
MTKQWKPGDKVEVRSSYGIHTGTVVETPAFFLEAGITDTFVRYDDMPDDQSMGFPPECLYPAGSTAGEDSEEE